MIRLANRSDIKNILEIVKDARELINALGFKQWSIEEDYPNYNSFLQDIEKNSLYVFEIENIVVGMMAIYKGIDENYKTIDGKWLTNNTNYTTVHRLAVKKEYYWRGIAKQLLEFAINSSTSSIRIDTHPKNIPMNSLIKKLGFTFCGTIYIKNCKIEPSRNAYELIKE